MEKRLKAKIKKYAPRVALILIFVGISDFFTFFSDPKKIVEFVGISNSYALIFVLSFIGGLTTFSGVPYHLVLITLAVAGLNPIFLGAAAAFGVILGDSTSYYLGYESSDIIPEIIKKILHRIYAFGSKHPRALPVFFFIYGSCVPLSNDFIVISMGLARYPFWRVMIPLGLGNLVFNISLALFSSHAYQLLARPPYTAHIVSM